MNAAQRLADLLCRQLPSASVTIDAPDTAKFPDAPWFIDVRYRGKHLPIEFRPEEGFGFPAEDSVGFDKPAYIELTTGDALQHALDVLSGARPA